MSELNYPAHVVNEMLTTALKQFEWKPIETAPRDKKILLGKIAGHPSHPTALWWAVAGAWSERWQNWNDGIEPAGLAQPNYWCQLPFLPPAASGQP